MNNDFEISIADLEQVFGGLEVLKRYGTKAGGTDLAIIRGALTERNSTHESKNTSVAYKTKTANQIGGVWSIAEHDFQSYVYDNISYYDNFRFAIRPIIQFNDVDLFNEVIKDKQPGVNGTFEVLFGEYPQYAVSKELQIELEERFKQGTLEKTGRSFTLDEEDYYTRDEDVHFNEYSFKDENGKERKFIRARALPQAYGVSYTVSNGETYKVGEIVPESEVYVWLEVEPVTWLVDEEKRTLVSKASLLSDIRFSDKRYDGDFETTNLYRFLTEIMLPELTRNEEYRIKRGKSI